MIKPERRDLFSVMTLAEEDAKDCFVCLSAIPQFQAEVTSLGAWPPPAKIPQVPSAAELGTGQPCRFGKCLGGGGCLVKSF